MLELFYDLVFVFAITQISHYLLNHQSWEGAGQSALILLVVWWSWNFATWFTNELDPTDPAVVGLVIAVMLASMMMALAIPEAFGRHALLFASTYVGIQVGRQLFTTYVAADAGTLERRRGLHILTWFVVAGAFWIAGALADGEARTALWIVALLIDYTGPLVTFRVPWLARVSADDWHVGSEHLAERFQLFVIIALGESIVLTGTTASSLDLTTTLVAGLAIAFLGTAALWWLYFNAIADRLHQTLAASEHRTIVARDTYTYLHSLLIAGIVAVAVGNEVMIKHPTEPLAEASLIITIAGPVIYLLAQAATRLRLTRQLSPRRIGAALACVVVGLALQNADAIVVAGGLLSVLVLSVAGDVIFGRRRVRSEQAAAATL
jgi:low temperature requirement protein LtrA